MRKNILSVLLCILLLMTGCTSSKSISFNEYAKKTNFKLKIQGAKKKLKKYRKLFQGKGLGKKANIV